MFNKTKFFHVDCSYIIYLAVLNRQSLNILSVYFNKFSISTQVFCQPTSSSLLKQVSYKLVDISQKKMADLVSFILALTLKNRGVESTHWSGDRLPFLGRVFNIQIS